MGTVGVPEMIFIFILALLVFGPQKLPELGRTLGKALADFRKASNDLRETFENEMREAERHMNETGRQIENTVGLHQEPAPDQSHVSTPPKDEDKPADGNVKPA